MKNLYGIFSIILVIALWWPETAVSQYWDDLYIRPSTREEIRQQREKQAEKERIEAAKKQAEAEKAAAMTSKQESTGETFVPDSLWDVDTYNRRYAEESIGVQASNNVDDVDAYNRRYTDQESSSADDTSYLEDDGYYLNGILRHAKRPRICRAHPQISQPAVYHTYHRPGIQRNLFPELLGLERIYRRDLCLCNTHLDQPLVLGLHVVAVQLLGPVMAMALLLLGLGLSLLRVGMGVELSTLSLLSTPLPPLSPTAPAQLPSYPDDKTLIQPRRL